MTDREPAADGLLEGVRVAVVYDCLFPWTTGGAERWYRALAERLAASGAVVTYLTRLQWDTEKAPDIPGVAVVAVMGSAGLYHPDGKRRTTVPLRFGWGVLRWLVHHRGEFDAVHTANFPFFSLIAARVALCGTKCRVYVDWHEVWPWGFWRQYAGAVAGTIGALIQRVAIALSPNAFVFSPGNKDRLRRAGQRGETVVLAGLLPVESALLEPALHPPATPNVLFAGRLIHDKGVEELPGILAAAKRHRPDLRMTVAGEGPGAERLAAEFSHLGLEDSVNLVGRVTDEQLLCLFSEASCTVVPSIREGYGIIVVESAAVGTPVVVAANPENLSTGHIAEGVNGFVVPPSADGLARGVLNVVDRGEALRRSTAEWYHERAPLMSVERATGEVVKTYRQHGVHHPERARDHGSGN